MGRGKWAVLLAVIAVALLFLAFAYFVWPTPWDYVDRGSGAAIVRVHRVTSEVQRVRAGYWQQLIPPWAKARPYRDATSEATTAPDPTLSIQERTRRRRLRGEEEPTTGMGKVLRQLRAKSP
jgi:hypothetical protein